MQSLHSFIPRSLILFVWTWIQFGCASGPSSNGGAGGMGMCSGKGAWVWVLVVKNRIASNERVSVDTVVYSL